MVIQKLQKHWFLYGSKNLSCVSVLFSTLSVSQDCLTGCLFFTLYVFMANYRTVSLFFTISVSPFLYAHLEMGCIMCLGITGGWACGHPQRPALLRGQISDELR